MLSSKRNNYYFVAPTQVFRKLSLSPRATPTNTPINQMKIKIDTTSNNEVINAELDKVNGKASSFTIASALEVEKIAARAEKKLELLPKAMRKGAVVRYRPAGPSANSYKYAAKSTRITIERGASGWFLTGVESAEVQPKRSENFVISITDAQADEIKARAIAPFFINR
jgi:hypothetical protein